MSFPASFPDYTEKNKNISDALKKITKPVKAEPIHAKHLKNEEITDNQKISPLLKDLLLDKDKNAKAIYIKRPIKAEIPKDESDKSVNDKLFKELNANTYKANVTEINLTKTIYGVNHNMVSMEIPVMQVPFNQAVNVIDKTTFKDKATLNNFIARFDGLCELVCNYMLINNLMGKGKNINALKDEINVKNLNADYIKKSHLMDVYGVFERMRAYFLGVYPDNILSYGKQKELIQKQPDGAIVVNPKILKKGLDKVKKDQVIKLEVFHKEGASFTGHSLLVKKTGDNEFIFFDPNTGEERGLNVDELADRINGVMAEFKGTDMVLIDGGKYLKRLEKKGIL